MSGLLHVTCPKCGKSGDIPDSFAGKGIHCKKCDTHFLVPHPGELHQTHGQAPTLAPTAAPIVEPALVHAPRAARAAAHALDPIPVSDLDTAPAPAPAAPQASILDALSDDAGLAPLTEEDEQHARQRYEARVLSKERSAHYDDHGNQLSEAEYEERKRQGRTSVH